MKIYKSVTVDIETGEVLTEDSYWHDGAISECKGGGGGTPWYSPQKMFDPGNVFGTYDTGGGGGGDISTTIISSPEARQLLEWLSPALQRIGERGGEGQPLYDVPGAPTRKMMGYFGDAVPSASGLMPTAENIGAISPDIKRAVAAPYLEGIGQVTEQFGGGMGSGMGGVSGAGAKILQDSMTQMIPQYTQQLWGMVQPGLQSEWTAQTAANLAQAQTGAQMEQAEWGADVAARAAPYGLVPEMAGGSMPSIMAQPAGKKG